MMITVDAADVSVAAGAGKILFFRFAAGSPAFTSGPIPCGAAVGAALSYRVGAATGAYTDGTLTTCMAMDWYAGSTNVMAFSNRPANPTYVGLLALSAWSHDGYFYVR